MHAAHPNTPGPIKNNKCEFRDIRCARVTINKIVALVKRMYGHLYESPGYLSN